jgi:luciferase family oxidoreductase group 1
MGKGLAVSVLDLVGMRAGEPAGSAIARSVDLAQHVERLGYKRYWLAEHHAIPGLACSATAVLIGHVAGATRTIRVGSGGVMLPNHAPLVVAEQFGTLEAMYPGRIDLGLGRAPGSDFHTMRALRRDLRQTGDDFPDLVEELQGYLGPEKPGQVVRAFPGQGSNVPITLLGSSGFSAQLAAMLGLPFAFAAHFAPEYLHVAVQLRCCIQILRSKVRRESKWQTQHPRQLRAEAARPQQRDRHIAPLSGNRFDHLPRLLRSQIGLQLLQKRRKLVPGLVQVPS